MPVSAPAVLASAGDDAFATPAAVALLSAATACRQPPPCLLVDCGITAARRSEVERVFAVHGVPLIWRSVGETQFAGLPLTEHLTAATYARLAVPELVGDLAPRSLYVDADTLTVASVEEVLGIDLAGNPVGAVQDARIGVVSRPGGVTGWRRLNLPAATAHLNGGVLLIDNAAWRSARISERVLELLQTHPEEATFADQGAVNAVLAGRWLPLDGRWNMAVPRSFAIEALGRVASRHVVVRRRDLGILHFTGTVKPWNPDYVPSPYRRMYRRALARYRLDGDGTQYRSLWHWARTRR